MFYISRDVLQKTFHTMQKDYSEEILSQHKLHASVLYCHKTFSQGREPVGDEH
jgi:hypothetical protein